MTARLIDQADSHKTKINHTSVVHLSIHARVGKGARAYVQSPKTAPEWGHVARRATTSLGDNRIMRDMSRTRLSGTMTMRRYRMV
eukprot:4373050-Pyramimonas_sp.AAC.1